MAECGGDHEGPCQWVNFQFVPPTESATGRSTLTVWMENVSITLDWNPDLESKYQIGDLIADLPAVITEASLQAQGQQMADDVEEMLKGEADNGE